MSNLTEKKVWRVAILSLLLSTTVLCQGNNREIAMEKAYQQIEARYEERDQTLQNDLKTYLE